jgi:hypothetical protein
MQPIPVSFSRLVAAYPDHQGFPAPTLLDAIGGEVRATVRDTDNTCAVRMSYCLNRAGAPIRRVAADVLYRRARSVADPLTPVDRRVTAGELYVIRAADVRRYLNARYHEGVLIWDGYRADSFKTSFSGVTQGIIVFEWRGRYSDFGASGHADLFRIALTDGQPPVLKPACIGDCYWMKGPMYAYFWETNP